MFYAFDKWLIGYLRSLWRRPRRVVVPRHLIFCVVDHFEPLEVLKREGVAKAAEDHVGSREQRLAVVRNWVADYPSAVEAIRDADGRLPRHTFFLSPDDYEPAWVAQIAQLCGRSFGEVELHLHHRNDTVEGLTQKLCAFRDALRREHGLLGSWREGRGFRVQGSGPHSGRQGMNGTGVSNRSVSGSERARADASAYNSVSGSESFATLNPEPRTLPPASSPAYGFIHGNWALCNSRPDGDWCGVNEELSVLAQTGCYADFTFPSAPSPTQPRMVNEIYRAWDTGMPRAHDRGVRCEVAGVRRQGSGDRSQSGAQKAEHRNPLMLIQGPIALDWHRRKWGVLPRLDNGGITHHNPPTPHRIDLWVEQGIHVRGRPEWVFVKVYTHGCVPSSSRVFLGGAMRQVHQHLQARYNDGKNWRLHYATARELYNIVRAAEDGRTGEPGEFRDYEVLPPPGAGG